MRRLLTVAAGLLLAATFARGALAGNHFNDPTGDSGAAPDITAVDVSNDAAGNVTILTTLVPRAAFASDELILVALDTDQNPSTGDQNGAEYAVLFGSNGAVFLRWNGSSYDPIPQSATMKTAVSFTPQAFTVTAVFNKADIGGVSTFNFFVATDKGPGDATDSFDSAPDGSADYSYALTAPPTVRTILATVPSVVHPGKRFAVSHVAVRLSDTTTHAVGSVKCTAKVGGRALPSAGRCAFKVPPAAAGKKIVVTVTVTYQGETYSTRYAVRVARK
jgi:hypothetical protein